MAFSKAFVAASLLKPSCSCIAADDVRWSSDPRSQNPEQASEIP
jgi:hypothetical protein